MYPAEKYRHMKPYSAPPLAGRDFEYALALRRFEQMKRNAEEGNS